MFGSIVGYCRSPSRPVATGLTMLPAAVYLGERLTTSSYHFTNMVLAFSGQLCRCSASCNWFSALLTTLQRQRPSAGVSSPCESFSAPLSTFQGRRSPSPANLSFESCSALCGAAVKGRDRLHRRISPLRVAPHSAEQPSKAGDRLHRRISLLRVAPHSAEQPSKAEIAFTGESPFCEILCTPRSSLQRRRSPSPANLSFESCSALRGAAFKGGDRLHRRISPLRVAPHSAEQPSKAEIAFTGESPL